MDMRLQKLRFNALRVLTVQKESSSIILIMCGNENILIYNLRNIRIIYMEDCISLKMICEMFTNILSL